MCGRRQQWGKRVRLKRKIFIGVLAKNIFQYQIKQNNAKSVWRINM